METTAADASGPGTKDPVLPTRSPSRRDGVVVAVTSAVLAFAAYLLWRVFSTCDGMDCLAKGPSAAFFSAIVMPGSAWFIWTLFGIPRPFRMAVTMVVIDHMLAISVVNAFGGGFGGGFGDIPGSGTGSTSPAVLGGPLMYILGGAAAGLAAMVLVWKVAFSRRARVLVLALIAAESIAGYGFSARVSTQQRADALGAVSVTLYVPDISGGGATASGASTLDGNGVRIAYDYDYGPGKDFEGPVVLLLAEFEHGCGVAPHAGYVGDPPEGTCRETADGFVADDGPGLHYVAVARDKTLLVFVSPKSVFDDALITNSLRTAPQVSSADLARL